MHRRPPEVPEAFWAAPRAHRWPGNVRELENFVQRALILSPGAVLELPEPLGGDGEPLAGASGRATRRRPVARPAPSRTRPARSSSGRSRPSGGRVYGPQGAAAKLGLKPSTLQGKMKKYGIGEG